MIDVQRWAAFSDGDQGGNPAGVVISDAPTLQAEMQRIARVVKYSETSFATRVGDSWRVRYFSPEAEIPFCGHATIALGAALTLQHGPGRYPLELAESNISVEGQLHADRFSIALQSPPTRAEPISDEQLQQALGLFGLTRNDLDQRVAPALIHAGSNHLLLMLRSKAALAAMTYDIRAGRRLMQAHGWVTVMLGVSESASLSMLAMRSRMEASTKIRRLVRRPPLWPDIFATSTGRMKAGSRSTKAMTWACRAD